MIVLETFPIYDGITSDDLKTWNFSFFYSMPFSFRKLVYAHQFFSDIDLLKLYLPYTSNHADWKNPDEIVSRIKDVLPSIKKKLDAGWHVDLPFQGYENYLTSLPPQLEPSQASAELVECAIPDFDERLSITKNILQISQNNQQDLILIEAPQHQNQYENCKNKVVGLVEGYNFSYQTLLENHNRSPLWFGKDQHMTQFGAIIASVETAQLLADKLNIDINREALVYYQSYFFRDYTLVHEDDSVTLTLIPENIEAITDVDFIWTVTLDGQEVFKIEEKGKNELSFTLPEPNGRYYIHIVIHNPVSDYYLRGGFSLVLE